MLFLLSFRSSLVMYDGGIMLLLSLDVGMLHLLSLRSL